MKAASPQALIREEPKQSEYVVIHMLMEFHIIIYVCFLGFYRCNNKPSCTFYGKYGCSATILDPCGSDDGFNHYFGNPCTGMLAPKTCLKIEYVCINGKSIILTSHKSYHNM